MKYKYVIWDWNGTLLDDVGAALASVNDMLALRGKEPIDLVRYRECIRGADNQIFMSKYLTWRMTIIS